MVDAKSTVVVIVRRVAIQRRTTCEHGRGNFASTI
jgi:hypothetical protein